MASLFTPDRDKIADALSALTGWTLLGPHDVSGIDNALRALGWSSRTMNGLATPQEAWEALVGRGVIPESWIDDPQRPPSCDRAFSPRGRRLNARGAMAS